MTRKTTMLFLLLTQAFVTSAQAEIYQCDGKWTNRPCDGAVERTLPESALVNTSPEETSESENQAEEPSKDDSPALEPLAPRYSLVRRLKKFNRDFSLKHKISIPKEEVRAFEERCMKRETPFDRCEADYDNFVKRLSSQINKKK